MSPRMLAPTILALLAPLAAADTVTTISGAIHEGTIVSRSEAGIVIETAGGRVAVPDDDVDSVERGPSPAETLAELAQKIPDKGGAEELLSAIEYALRHGLDADYRRLANLLERRAEGTDLATAWKGRSAVRKEFEAALKDPANEPALKTRLESEAWLGAAFVVSFREDLYELERTLLAREAPRIESAWAKDLEKARAAALAFIRNPKRYPPASAPPTPGQEAVDRLVGEVERLYRASAEARSLREDRRAGSTISELETRLDLYAKLGGKETEALRSETDAVLARAVAIVDFPAEDRRRWRKRLAANDEAEGPADAESRRVVRLINEYRLMMGVRPLSVDESLCKAGQGHAQAMVDHGFFGHVSPLKGLETHDRRAVAAGYESTFVNEEIANGCATPEAALAGWKLSPDHHRGLVRDDMREIGAGHVNTTWCFLMGNPALNPR